MWRLWGRDLTVFKCDVSKVRQRNREPSPLWHFQLLKCGQFPRCPALTELTSCRTPPSSRYWRGSVSPPPLPRPAWRPHSSFFFQKRRSWNVMRKLSTCGGKESLVWHLSLQRKVTTKTKKSIKIKSFWVCFSNLLLLLSFVVAMPTSTAGIRHSAQSTVL